ncbi:deaminase [Aliarcobacter butzleri]|uniref:Deoxycytidylate deaminase n=1 Tax=Aliarcobacter butzleri L348 TaxID=1447256 RepID=A0A0G9JUT9_9BACT|nr:deaminase [Aliarcobacter butzleri]KLD98058.1 deoxycytidylate deaminase [Aliarcobacter butzleri L348]
MTEAIKQIYKHRKDFILIGLTGKIGAGCSTTAKFMTQDISSHNLPSLCISNSSSDIDRKKYIIQKFYLSNWKPFVKITASDVITSFLLENDFNTIQKFFIDNHYKKFDDSFEETYNKFYEEQKIINFKTKDTTTYEYINDKLCNASKIIKKALGIDSSYRNYSEIYQKIGDNLRLHGSVIANFEVNLENIFTISERINDFIKIIKYQKIEIDQQPAHIVIDAFRNPFEAMYFKERYAAFYLFSINAEQRHVEDRLARGLKMSIDQIKQQDDKENPSDTVDSAENFVSQNIKACIQKSDVHIANNGMYGNSNYHELYGQIIKYISLIQHPGLITPSLDEKMMQVAHTAKLNSACLSRQVGASITNEYGSLKAIGWNSVADGQTPCLLRSKDEILRGTESKSFSIYEKGEKFKKAIIEFYPKIESEDLVGRNQSFCFSEIHNKQIMAEKNQNTDACKCDKNQVHTRSLHAEENAFLQISKYGGEGIKNGTLYSTASPCELCSKKAYQLGIKRVVYIDPYPGTAQEQILLSGLYSPKVELFKGAIGNAYNKLYEPIISYKDELSALRTKI